MSDKLYWPIEKLKNWDKNPRSITEKNFKRLKQQIEQLGEFKPLLITEDGTVLGGNMRLRAYQELGWKQVWVSIVEAETEQEKLEFALADNDRAGDYDEQQLAELVLSVPEIDLSLFHIDLGKTVDLSAVVSKFGPDPVEDEPPAVEEEAVSKLGEVYQLGRHRVMCGDSTNKEDVEKLMDGQKADMVFTDPPYGVSYQEKAETILGRKDRAVIENDGLGKDALKLIVFPAFQNIAQSLKDGGVYYVCSPQGGELGLMMMMMMMMMDAGIECRHMIVWKKDSPVFSMGRLDYDYQHEPILYGWRGSHQHYGNGKYKTSIWDIPRPNASKLHPTMKPIELIDNALRNSTKEGDISLDLFLGSGSTLIACEQTNRTCYGMEIDPRYVDVIRKRYAKFIGKEDQWQEVTPTVKQ